MQEPGTPDGNDYGKKGLTSVRFAHVKVVNLSYRVFGVSTKSRIKETLDIGEYYLTACMVYIHRKLFRTISVSLN